MKKVLLVNGSPHKNGNSMNTLKDMVQEVTAANQMAIIDTEPIVREVA